MRQFSQQIMTAQLLGNPGSLFTPISTSFLPFGSSTDSPPCLTSKGSCQILRCNGQLWEFYGNCHWKKSKRHAVEAKEMLTNRKKDAMRTTLNPFDNKMYVQSHKNPYLAITIIHLNRGLRKCQKSSRLETNNIISYVKSEHSFLIFHITHLVEESNCLHNKVDQVNPKKTSRILLIIIQNL